MDNTKIAFFDAKPYDIKSFTEVNGEDGYAIKYFKHHLTPDTAGVVEGYPVVCAFVNDTLNQAVIDQLYDNGVRLAALRCAGYNNVDLSAAYGKIHVVRVPAYSPHAVAEHAAALMLTLNRKTHRAYYRIRDNNFAINGLLGFDMHGKTAGIIGTGKIGRILIRILRGFGMTVLAYDYKPDPSLEEEAGMRFVDLDTLYRESDIISLHCPLTNDTHHLINRDSLALMKDNVMLINTGRGQLINTKDLIDALKSRKVGSAGLDVYEEESDYFFEDLSDEIISDDVLARLLSFSNVLVTSHQGFFTREALQNIALTTLSSIRAYFAGGTLEHEVCYRCDADPCRKQTEGKCF
jgi:D-lactate dehydrogenase